MTILTRDETWPVSADAGESLEWDSGLSLRDLISKRVRAEVRRANGDGKERRLIGLLELSQRRGTLKLEGKKPVPIDADDQVEIAFRAFEEGRYFVFLPGRQAASLDEPVALEDGDEVIFLRVMPLVGG